MSFVVYGRPEPAGSKTAGVTKTGRRYLRDANPKAADWKRSIQATVGARFGGPLLEGPVQLHLVFYLPRPKTVKRLLPITKPDSLKLARAAEDALTHIVYRDDAQVVTLRVDKRYGSPARCEIRVGSYQPPDHGEAA